MLANQKSFGWYIQAIGIFVISLALMAKVYSFASEGTWPNARQRMVVAVEFVLVAWSVWDLCSTWLRVAVSVFFSVSFAYNLTRLLSGETSCDCFGGFHFPLPLVVFISAAIAIASLIANVRSLNNVPSDAWFHKVRSFAFAESVALSTIVVILAMSAFEGSVQKIVES